MKFLWIILFFLMSSVVNAGAWQEVKNENDISVYLQEVEGSEFKQFKAQLTINKSASIIFDAIKSDESCTTWKVDCLLYPLATGHYLLVNDLPWPLSDRFVIYKTKMNLEKTVLSIQSIPLSNLLLKQLEIPISLEGKVEMLHYNGFWKVIETSKDISNVLYQMHTNPSGNIPKSVVNAKLSNKPFNVLSNLKAFVE